MIQYPIFALLFLAIALAGAVVGWTELSTPVLNVAQCVGCGE